MNVQDSDFYKELLEVFILEGQEHIDTMKRCLQELEQKNESDDTKGVYEEIKRAAHSLKGAARTVGFENLESVGYGFEKLFGRMGGSNIMISEEIAKNLKSAFDALEKMIIALKENGKESVDNHEALSLIEKVENIIS
ncbi:MAG: Hpt domain-containing protein [bacterium]